MTAGPGLDAVVFRFDKRAAGADLPAFRQQALRQAQEAPCPAGCHRIAHSQPVDRAYRQGEPAFDAMTAYAFASREAAGAWRQHLAATGAQVLLARMQPVIDGDPPAGSFQHVELVRRRADLEPDTFLAYWRDVHGPLAAAIPHLLRYLQCPADESGCASSPPVPDGVALLWFASLEAMREGARDPAFTRTREDMANFMDPAASQSVLTQEAWSFSR